MKKDLTERLEILLVTCLQARTHYGVDCFFDYMPHVDYVRVHIHKNGWEKNHAVDKEFYIETVINSYMLDSQEWFDKQIKVIDECGKYIMDCCESNLS